MGLYPDNATYLLNVRTPNTDVVRDAQILNSSVATLRISAYGPYHAQNQKLGLLIVAAKEAYNPAP